MRVGVSFVLVDFLYASLKYYRRIRCEDLRVVPLQGGDRLLPELPVALGCFTLRKMRGRRVDVRLSTRAVQVTGFGVRLEWNWAMFFPSDIAHLSFRRTRVREADQWVRMQRIGS